MDELIVAARIQIEDARFFRMSRAGMTVQYPDNQTSVLFSPKDSPYTVKVQEVQMDDLYFAASHAFVGRFVKYARITKPFQVWRWHVDVWPTGEANAPLYAEFIEKQFRPEGNTYRVSFEHIAGPRLVNPYLLAMQIAGNEVVEAVVTKDLVPERLQYKDTYDVLPHPGAMPVELGILAPYEDLMQRTRVMATPARLM